MKARDIRKAVNPMMYMVRVDCLDARSGAYVPAGALTSFSIHGTTVPSQNTLYNADVFAYMERELEWEMARKYKTVGFVHAVVNGTHADIAPDIICDGAGYRESRRIGVGLGWKAIGLFNSLEKQLSGRVKVGAALREIDYYREQYHRRDRRYAILPGWAIHCLPARMTAVPRPSSTGCHFLKKDPGGGSLPVDAMATGG